ncbi:hypothetical protein F2Q70_00025962 [Brassica cretica]|uniref:Arabidopsis retrotransposon Orf1 C-terminal domain-containing protein n=1 Tax=Brassica cretica TaxID=69181 RepID=A0A8S9L984_BRACR|nr:hypothetical protein F2Q70_00025962 [Brassica cretica]
MFRWVEDQVLKKRFSANSPSLRDQTTEDLAAIRESVELLNKRIEEERAALEKKRERLNSENAAEISKEIQRLSDDALEFSKTGEEARFAVDKAVCEIERTGSKIKAAKMCLVAARKMKEAARAAETFKITEIQDVTRRRRTRETLQEEIFEKIEETAQEIRSSRRTIEEGLETVNSAKMEAEEEEETQWQWSERRRRSSSTYKGKYTNRRETVLMDVSIEPKWFVDLDVIRALGIKSDLEDLFTELGMGNLATNPQVLNPELVRQFMATVNVYNAHERENRANEGVLIRYRVPISTLCTIYGFENEHQHAIVPEFPGILTFWEHIATVFFDSAQTLQTDNRHPPLLYFMMVLANTLLCKMEPNKLPGGPQPHQPEAALPPFPPMPDMSTRPEGDFQRVVVDALTAIWARVSRYRCSIRRSVRASSPLAAGPSRQRRGTSSSDTTDED